jgi:histidinol-phosphate aminotransferase
MSQDYLALALPCVQKLSPYVPGKPIEELQRELGLSDIIKLASNENPLGPSPRVIDAIQKEIAHLTLYPDGNGFVLKQAIASRFDLELPQITLGNGSNDVLDLIARAYLGPGRAAVYSQYGFAVYPISTQSVGAQGIVVPAHNFGHDLDAMAAAITPETTVVFVANPNNPTGTWFTRAQLQAFLDKVPDRVIVVLDEAYTEYVDQEEFPNGFEYLSAHPNLVVTRTFSKAYGLAGLRVGYSVSNPQIADALNRVRQPFNVDSLALVAATAALADDEYLERSRAVNLEGLRLLEEGFGKLGLEYIPSVGNFVTVHFDRPAQPIYQGLLQRGVIVRPVANYGMPNSLRISVGTLAENQRFLDALSSVLAA